MSKFPIQARTARAGRDMVVIADQFPPLLTREDRLAAQIGIADAGCGCPEPALPRNELSRFARAMLWIFGDHAPRPLANPRLELVRRFFCATRAGYSPSVTVMSELHKLGLQPVHLAAIAGLLS